MNNKYFIITVSSLLIAGLAIIWSLFFMNMANDLNKKVKEIEEENVQLKWENENNYMYCTNGKKWNK